jgi:hypothetical protein
MTQFGDGGLTDDDVTTLLFQLLPSQQQQQQMHHLPQTPMSQRIGSGHLVQQHTHRQPANSSTIQTSTAGQPRPSLVRRRCPASALTAAPGRKLVLCSSVLVIRCEDYETCEVRISLDITLSFAV